jgi:GNAT superfamily N-acetyltransferase
LAEHDRPWVAGVCRRYFGGETVVPRGGLHQRARRPGRVAGVGGRPAGALCFSVEPGGAEVVLLVGEPPGRGAGSALLAALDVLASERGWARLWLMVTNDNTPALRFYQRRGWDLVALHARGAERDRGRKPEMPERGVDGIRIRHLLELQRVLAPAGEVG